jgi:hypothetical protein
MGPSTKIAPRQAVDSRAHADQQVKRRKSGMLRKVPVLSDFLGSDPAVNKCKLSITTGRCLDQLRAVCWREASRYDD